MNGLVVGANKESIYAILTAKKNGIKVIAVDGDPIAKGLKHSDIAIVKDIKNEKEMIKLAKEYKIDFIIPTPIGRYLTTIGAINDSLNLIGISKDSATICTDKLLFHSVLNNKGLRNIKSDLLKNNVEDIKFPAIVKPRFGSGSKNVKIYSDKRYFYKNAICNNEDYIIEEVYEGKEYGLDAVVINGLLHIILIREKVLTPVPNRQAIGYFSTIIDKNKYLIEEEIYSKVQEAVKVIGIKNSIIHADVIISNYEAFIIELSGRPSGHNLYDKFTPMVTEVNMIREYLNYIALKECSLKPKKNDEIYFIGYFNLPNMVIKKVPEFKTINRSVLVDYEVNLKIGDKIEPHNDDRLIERGFYILKSKDLKVIKELRDEIEKEFMV